MPPSPRSSRDTAGSNRRLGLRRTIGRGAVAREATCALVRADRRCPLDGAYVGSWTATSVEAKLAAASSRLRSVRGLAA